MPDFSLPTVRCPGDYSRSFAARFLANYCARSRALRLLFSDEEGSKGKDGEGSSERFEILCPRPRKFDRVEGRSLSCERVEGEI